MHCQIIIKFIYYQSSENCLASSGMIIPGSFSVIQTWIALEKSRGSSSDPPLIGRGLIFEDRINAH